MDDELAQMRQAYVRLPLKEATAPDDPVELFASWLAEAVDREVVEPNAMVLATADAAGRPSTRHVLLKGVDHRGFTFYTNLGSRKAAEIAANPAVSLCFPWIAMERQVVVAGHAERVTLAEDAAYWATRPRDSQLGAWASEQSSVIGSRAELEERAAAMAERFPDDITLPEFWGGFRVAPSTIEFWQGAPARLHDRLRYRRIARGWHLERLAP